MDRGLSFPRSVDAGDARVLPLHRPRTRLRWLDVLMRFGHLSRGFVYLIPGVFALRLALGRQGAAITQSDSMKMISGAPFGHVLLVLIAVGLVGYVLWGFYRAFFDALGKGHSPKGLFIRLGYLTSALAYIALLVVAVQLLTGSPSHPRAEGDWVRQFLSRPQGPLLIGVVGVVWILAGSVVQIAVAWSRAFERELDLEHMSRTERIWVARLGQFGLAARGVVFGLIGVALIGAALHLPSKGSPDLSGAFVELMRQPYGHILLLVAATGLIAFGIYSILCVRWARLDAAPGSVRAHGPSLARGQS